ncbi:mucin-16-like [Manis pentadactyla]|uniref:mucin-16-like n=1 Tax=Manis pentadactyla TaxID=143292 RepID=UPI00255C5B5D|nr:mucin-16-like [Manis pentadactyla]
MESSSPYVDPSSSTETGTGPSPSSTAVTGGSGTQVTTSSRIPSPGLAQSTGSSDISRPSAPPAMIESERKPIALQTGPPGTPTLDALPSDRSATVPWAGTHSAVTQGFAQAEMTSPRSRGTEAVTQVSPPSAEEAGPATASWSPVPSTFQGHSTSSLSMSSGLPTTPSLESGAGAPQRLSHTSADILATSEATTCTEQLHPSTPTAVTNVGIAGPRQEPHSSVPTDSEPAKATSPVVATSTRAEATVPTPMSSVSEPETSPSWTPGMRAMGPF